MNYLLSNVCGQITHAMIHLHNKSFVVRFSLNKECDIILYSRVSIALGNEKMEPIFNSNLGSFHLNYQVNEFILRLDDVRFVQPRWVFITLNSSISLNAVTRIALENVEFDMQGQYFKIKQLNIEPTSELHLRLQVYNVSGIRIHELIVGPIELDNSFCQGFNELIPISTEQEGSIFCNLSKLNLSQAESLKNYITRDIVAMTIEFKYEHMLFDGPIYQQTVQTQVVSNGTYECLSDPLFVLSEYQFQAVFRSRLIEECYEDVLVVNPIVNVNFENGTTQLYGFPFYELQMMYEEGGHISYNLFMEDNNLISEKNMRDIASIEYEFEYVYANHSHKYLFNLSEEQIVLSTIAYIEVQMVESEGLIRFIFEYTGSEVGMWHFNIMFTDRAEVLGIYLVAETEVKYGYNVLIFTFENVRERLDYTKYIKYSGMPHVIQSLFSAKNLFVQVATDYERKALFSDIIFKRPVEEVEIIMFISMALAVLIFNMLYFAFIYKEEAGTA